MVKCDYCGFDPGTLYSQCSLCGGTFCRIHKSPPDHQCARIDKWKTQGEENKSQASSFIHSDNENVKFQKGGPDESTPSSNTVMKTALVLGILIFSIGLIIFGVFLYVGNRSGQFPTFPFAGFFTMSFGFLLLAILLKQLK